MKHMFSLVCGIAVLFAVVSLVAQDEGSTVKWEPSFQEALDKAKKDNLMVMIYFYIDGSRMCGDFENLSINQPSVIELSKKFVCVKVEKNKEKDIAAKFNASAVPMTLFIDINQKKLGLVRGYEDPGPFATKVKDVFESIEIEKKARETLDKDSENLEANLQLAKVWVIRDYRDQAILLFQKVVDGDPKNKKGFLVEAAFRLGFLQYENGMSAPSKENFKKVRKYDVMDKKGYGDDMLLAESHIDMNDSKLDEALEKLRLFTVKYSSSELMPMALYRMGHVYYQKNDTKKTIEAWEKLVKDYPSSPEAERAEGFIQQLKQQEK